MENNDEKREENSKMEEEMKRGWRVDGKDEKVKGSDKGQRSIFFRLIASPRTVGFAPAALLVML
jgi:hypothetical protein